MGGIFVVLVLVSIRITVSAYRILSVEYKDFPTCLCLIWSYL